MKTIDKFHWTCWEGPGFEPIHINSLFPWMRPTGQVVKALDSQASDPGLNPGPSQQIQVKYR